jgi:hypothetical protein
MKLVQTSRKKMIVGAVSFAPMEQAGASISRRRPSFPLHDEQYYGADRRPDNYVKDQL